MSSQSLLGFFLVHLMVGAFLPLADDIAPPFFRLVLNAGRELERRLNRAARGVAALRLRGGAVTVFLAVMCCLIGGAVLRLMSYENGWIVGAAFLFSVSSVMMPLMLLRACIVAFDRNDSQRVTALLQPYCRESLWEADHHTLVRKALEISAMSLDVYFFAPLFWFMVAGAPGALLFVMFSALSRAFGDGHFGAFPRAVDKVLNAPPAVLTAALLALSALFVSRSNPLRSFATAVRQAGNYKVAWLGWPIAAMAGGLGVTLGGPVRYPDGSTVEHGWIGPEGSTARLTAADLQRGAMIHFVFFLCLMVLVAASIALWTQYVIIR